MEDVAVVLFDASAKLDDFLGTVQSCKLRTFRAIFRFDLKLGTDLPIIALSCSGHIRCIVRCSCPRQSFAPTTSKRSPGCCLTRFLDASPNAASLENALGEN
jgi:hypothetical protein